MAGLEELASSVPRLHMRGISKVFGATKALESVQLSVALGEVHGLVGENGAGKSTLMKILSGALAADSGEMFLDGTRYRPQSPLDARLSGIGMIYQELSLASHLTVEENIVLGLEPRRFGLMLRKEIRRRAVDALRELDHPEINPDIKVQRLSVGAQQIVEIARSLSSGCKILILDEPTSSLAQQDVGRLFQLIRRLKRQGQSIVYISHFLEEVKAVTDRITVLRDGQVAGSGNTAEISIQEMVRMMVGRTVEQLYPRSQRSKGEPVLEAKDLKGSPLPVSASLSLCRGEVLGIAGLVGAGRTELLKSLFGLNRVLEGSLRIGMYTGPASPVTRWLQGTGFLSEDRKAEGVALRLSLSDNMTLCCLRRFGPCGLVFPSRMRNASTRWIQELDIRCKGPMQQIQALSGGNQQKVALGRLLLHDADLLLLDEPTRGIDVKSKALIYKIIDELASGLSPSQTQPKSILMVSSYLPELLGVCDRIAVMCRGILGRAKPVSEWTEHDLMLEATGQGRCA